MFNSYVDTQLSINYDSTKEAPRKRFGGDAVHHATNL